MTDAKPNRSASRSNKDTRLFSQQWIIQTAARYTSASTRTGRSGLMRSIQNSWLVSLHRGKSMVDNNLGCKQQRRRFDRQFLASVPVSTACGELLVLDHENKPIERPAVHGQYSSCHRCLINIDNHLRELTRIEPSYIRVKSRAPLLTRLISICVLLL